MQPLRQLHFLKFGSAIITYLLPLILVCGLWSCRSNIRANPTPTDTTDYIRIPSGELSNTEKAVLSEKCEKWFDNTLKKSPFTGGMLVAKNGVTVFERFQGYVKPGSPQLVDKNTSMHIASVSKTITAAAILKLMEEGKLSLDDPLSKFFPDFNYPGVTIQSLLNHRSGLPNYAYFTEDLKWDKTKPISNRDILQLMTNRKSEIKNIAKPNTHFNYSNTNFVLLALVIEQITQMPYDTYLRKIFFTPLQMKHTYVFHLADSIQFPGSYKSDGIPIAYDYLDNVYGDKNIYSTVEDLLIWDRALTLGLILKPETLELAYTPYSNEKAGIRNYGLGWRMNIFPNGKRIIYHNGWWHGSNASFVRLLDEQATIIVIGNHFTRNIYKAVKLASLFGPYPVGGETLDDGVNFNIDHSGEGK